MSGSKVAPGAAVPKFAFAMAPHSPLAAGLVMTQSGTKFLLASAHERVVVTTIRLTGLRPAAMPVAESPCTYLLRVAFSAVFPLPKRSYAAPRRGVRSFNDAPL